MDFDDAVSRASSQMAEKHDKILYEAAEQGAEAVIFKDDLEASEKDGGDETVFRTQQSYKICQSIMEVKGAKTVFDSGFTYNEIPASFHRIAEETSGYGDFINKLMQEHPKFDGDEL